MHPQVRDPLLESFTQNCEGDAFTSPSRVSLGEEVPLQPGALCILAGPPALPGLQAGLNKRFGRSSGEPEMGRRWPHHPLLAAVADTAWGID